MTSVLDAGLADLLAALGISGARVRGGGTEERAGLPSGAPALALTRDDLSVELWGRADRTAADAVLRTVRRDRLRAAASDDLTAALVRANDQLLAFYDLARLQVGSLDATEAVDRVLAEALRLADADVALLDGAEPTCRHAGHDSAAAAWLEVEAARFDRQRARAVAGESLRGALAPVRGGSGPPGVLGLARRSGRPFDTGDLKLLDAIAATIAGLRELAGLHRRLVDRAVIEHEHDTASKLAQAVLPERPPALPGLHLFARSIPARTAGGDFFTFGVLDGVLRFAVGDVAGKGLPAALVMTKVVATANAAFAGPGVEPVHRTLAAIDDRLYDYLSEGGLFVTMVVGAFRPGSGVVQLCNAGHSPVMVVRRDGVEVVPASRPPIGVLPGLVGRAQCLPVSPGDLLVVGSDGLAEQENEAGEMLGYDRLAAELSHRWRAPAGEVGRHLLQLVAEHAGEVSAADDRTLVVLEVGA
jgi:serine phosphatase RsbU (regulator of sigma subunit)